MCGVAKVDEDGLGVSDVQISVRLWREARVHQPTGSLEVGIAQRRRDLRIPTRLVQLAEETLRKDRSWVRGDRRRSSRRSLGLRRLCRLRFLFAKHVNQRRQPTHILGWRGHTLPLGFAASFAPNLSASADSTAFFTSRVFAQRNAGVFLSAVMAAPMFAHPVTADELTYSATALESASGVILNPVGVVHEEENQMSNASRG